MLKYKEKPVVHSDYKIRLQKEDKKYKLFFTADENKIGILYKISAVLYIQNWNIINMEANTTEEGCVEDSFLIEPLEKGFSFALESALLSDIENLFNSDQSVMSYLAGHPGRLKNIATQREKNPGKLQIRKIKNGAFRVQLATIDRPGLIFEITQILFRLYFDIQRMESVTIDKEAHDTLYVVRDPEKRSRFDKKILTRALAVVF